MIRKTRLKLLILSLIGLISLSVLGGGKIWPREAVFLDDCLLDYDFYLDRDSLYLFSLEGRGLEKYNEIYQKTYKCSRRLRVYERKLKKKEGAISPLSLNQKAKRREFFTSDRPIEKVAGQMRLIYENDLEVVNPWLISVGKLRDEEGVISIFLGAYRETYFYQDNTRPYFLEFKEGVITRRWTGSKLNHLAFEDAYLEDPDLDGLSQVKVYERHLERGQLKDRIAYYKIDDFTPYEIKGEEDAD